MLSRSKLIFIFIVICILAIVWGIFDYIRTEEDKNELIIYGNVDVRNVALAFRVSGRLAKMNYEEGAHVNRGDVLAALDNDTYLADLASSKAELTQALAYEKNALVVFERRTKLTANGAISKALYDDAIASLNANKALVLTKKASLDKAYISLNDTELHAPNSGIILTRVREPGAIVDPTQIVYTLTLDNPVWVRTYVEEPDLGKIHPGQKAEIFTDSAPDKPYHGYIGFISPEAEFTPKYVQTTQLRTALVYRLRVIVDNSDQGLRQGMPVTIKIRFNEE